MRKVPRPAWPLVLVGVRAEPKFVYLVDSLSTDGTVDRVREKFPRVRIEQREYRGVLSRPRGTGVGGAIGQSVPPLVALIALALS